MLGIGVQVPLEEKRVGGGELSAALRGFVSNLLCSFVHFVGLEFDALYYGELRIYLASRWLLVNNSALSA